MESILITKASNLAHRQRYLSSNIEINQIKIMTTTSSNNGIFTARTPIQYSESSPDLGLREFIICRDFVV